MPSAPPEKKSAKPKPKVKVMDHDKLSIEMVDDVVDTGMFRYPKFRPNNHMMEDELNSPKKSVVEASEEELKVYDKLQESSSRIHTDSTMKDYDYDIEPDMNFPQFRPIVVQNKLIGDGLGVETFQADNY